MANPVQEHEMRRLAKYVEKTLKRMYGIKMGFALITFPFGSDDRTSDYIGNCDRTSMIKALRETADRLERKQDIPASKGSS